MKSMKVWLAAVLMMIPALYVTAQGSGEYDLFEQAPWSGSLELGFYNFEGDEEVQDAPFIALRLGYDLNPRWTIEADFNWIPVLEPTDFQDPRRSDIEDDTWGVRLGLDVLFHLRNIENLRWDPYLSFGAGWFHYGTSDAQEQDEPIVIAGLGMFYHFNDEWAVRLDVRPVITGFDTEGNILGSAGINWRWGARVPEVYELEGTGIDSDGDGLLDSEEAEIGTDPYNPDTDGDGLLDGQEVKEYKTDPLNPDTDWDALKDGPEVLTYRTDPNDRDTDDGGVADGHEVIEDHTDPLDPSDDLQLFTLNIEFDYDKSFIRPQYFEQLDVVAKVLQRDPGATAKVEGHADKRPTSKEKYNLHLSERRAKAVMEYLITAGGIEPSRLTSKGYGFSVPVAPNDTEENMQKNRRTEIYITPSDEARAAKAGKSEGSAVMDMSEPQEAPEAMPEAMPEEMPVK